MHTSAQRTFMSASSRVASPNAAASSVCFCKSASARSICAGRHPRCQVSKVLLRKQQQQHHNTRNTLQQHRGALSHPEVGGMLRSHPQH